MKETGLLIGAMGTTVILTIFVITAPLAAIAFFAGCAALLILFKTHGWWRRFYVILVVSMFASASSIPALSAPGKYAKVAALGVLLVSTYIVNQGKQGTYANKSHKMLTVALILIAGFIMASAIWSQYRAATLLEGGTAVALIYILHRTSTVRWVEPKQMIGDLLAGYWTAVALIGTGTVLGLAGVPAAVLWNGRHQGILSNPNLLGAIAALVVGLGVGLAIHKRSPLLWLSLVIPVSAIVLSQSRTAMLATCVGLVLAVIRAKPLYLIPMGFIAAISTLWVMIAGYKFSGAAIERFSSMDGGDVLNSRGDVWKEVLWNIQQNPLGVGWAATPDALKSLYETGSTTSGLYSTHNSWVQIFNELGWAGLIPIAILFFALARVIFTAKTGGIGVGLVATIIAGSLIHFTESVMFGVGQPYPYIFWFVALAATVHNGNAEQLVDKNIGFRSKTKIV